MTPPTYNATLLPALLDAYVQHEAARLLLARTRAELRALWRRNDLAGSRKSVPPESVASDGVGVGKCGVIPDGAASVLPATFQP